ncbi:MAG: hypothetical protein R2857_11675 [Vampirovibrionales bacterium]
MPGLYGSDADKLHAGDVDGSTESTEFADLKKGLTPVSATTFMAASISSGRN